MFDASPTGSSRRPAPADPFCVGGSARCIAVVLACALAFLCLGSVAQAAPGDAGRVRFVKEANSAFDSYVRAPTAPQAQWMRDHYFRQKTYAPFFDSRTSWYRNAWTYRDAYAIYTDGRSSVPSQHPDWVLKDERGRRLYIPWGCANGTCPQYAGDIGNPAFRRWWIDGAIRTVRNGYRGLFVDDVNLYFSVSDGSGDHTAPIDPRTGREMTEPSWRNYMADFVQQISREVRAAVPGVEIAHNPVWFAGHSDPDIARALLAADYVNLERGVSDNLSRGDGRFGIETFFGHVDWLHEHGKAVVYDSYADTEQSAEYNLAAYFLTAGQRDGFRTDYRSTPSNWWSGYNVELGAPHGPRHHWNGLIRRDFENGFVLVNEPQSPARTIDLPPGARGPDGAARPSTTLPAASGRVVVTGGARPRRARPAVILHAVANPRLARTSARAHRGARAARRRAAALVVGRVVRAHGGRVRVMVQRRVAGNRWRVVRRATPRLRPEHRFRRVFRGLRRGTYRVRARYVRKAGHVAAHRSKRMRIRR
jgi:Hypothetical glycosyl hydrolase family 15